MQVLGCFDFDHVLHGDLVIQTLALVLVRLVDVDACVALLSLQRPIVALVLVGNVPAHDNVHAVILQSSPVA